MSLQTLQAQKNSLQISLDTFNKQRNQIVLISNAEKAPYIKELQRLAEVSANKGTATPAGVLDLLKGTENAKKAFNAVDEKYKYQLMNLDSQIEKVKQGILKIDESIAAQEMFEKSQETQKRILADIKKAEEENAKKAAIQKRNRYLLYAGGALFLYLMVQK